MSSETDVIIIGAGSAGLSAAKELTKQGLSYTLVEGSHRIGGRAYSEEIAPGVWFDLGCSYLHQGETNPFVAIADGLGIELGMDHGDMFSDENMRYYFNGKSLDKDQLNSLWQYFNQCHSDIMAAAKRGEDISVAELMDLDNPYASPLMSEMAGNAALDVDQLSSADYASFGGGSDIPVLNGYGNLVTAWAADVPVSLNTKVDCVDCSGSTVRVETNKGTLKGRAVLSTVSNGILAANHIRFKSALPNWKIDAINAVPIGTMNKICLHFSEDVFGPDGRGYHTTWCEGEEGSGIEASVMGQNKAIIFTGGRHAIWLEKQGQQAGHDFAVTQVANVFGNDIRKSVSKSIVTAWNTDPWTLGSYAATLPGQFHQREELARPVEDRLFFAGEVTIVGSQATCHGAYLSGIRAATEIAAVI